VERIFPFIFQLSGMGSCGTFLLYDIKILVIVLTLQIQNGKCCALGGFLIKL